MDEFEINLMNKKLDKKHVLKNAINFFNSKNS
jgi:hypothetical protein